MLIRGLTASFDGIIINECIVYWRIPLFVSVFIISIKDWTVFFDYMSFKASNTWFGTFIFVQVRIVMIIQQISSKWCT